MNMVEYGGSRGEGLSPASSSPRHPSSISEEPQWFWDRRLTNHRARWINRIIFDSESLLPNSIFSVLWFNHILPLLRAGLPLPVAAATVPRWTLLVACDASQCLLILGFRFLSGTVSLNLITCHPLPSFPHRPFQSELVILFFFLFLTFTVIFIMGDHLCLLSWSILRNADFSWFLKTLKIPNYS